MQNLLHTIKCLDCGREYQFLTGINEEQKFVNPYFCQSCGCFHSIPTADEDERFRCVNCKEPLEKIKFIPVAAESNSIEQTYEILNEVTKTGTMENTDPYVCCPNCKSYNLEIFVSGTWE